MERVGIKGLFLHACHNFPQNSTFLSISFCFVVNFYDFFLLLQILHSFTLKLSYFFSLLLCNIIFFYSFIFLCMNYVQTFIDSICECNSIVHDLATHIFNRTQLKNHSLQWAFFFFFLFNFIYFTPLFLLCSFYCCLNKNCKQEE